MLRSENPHARRMHLQVDRLRLGVSALACDGESKIGRRHQRLGMLQSEYSRERRMHLPVDRLRLGVSALA